MTWEPRGRLGRPGCGDASPARGFRGADGRFSAAWRIHFFFRTFPAQGQDLLIAVSYRTCNPGNELWGSRRTN